MNTSQPPSKPSGAPSDDLLEAVALEMLTGMLAKDMGKKPSQNAVEIAAKILASRARRELNRRAVVGQSELHEAVPKISSASMRAPVNPSSAMNLYPILDNGLRIGDNTLPPPLGTFTPQAPYQKTPQTMKGIVAPAPSAEVGPTGRSKPTEP